MILDEFYLVTSNALIRIKNINVSLESTSFYRTQELVVSLVTAVLDRNDNSLTFSIVYHLQLFLEFHGDASKMKGAKTI